MNQTVLIEVAPGELIDKLTILEIKLARLADGDKRRNVAVELSVLRQALTGLAATETVVALREQLGNVNEALWDIEDAIRSCERRGDFGPGFVSLARAVYRRNDERAALKRSINVALGSHLIEEKSYAAYA